MAGGWAFVGTGSGGTTTPGGNDTNIQFNNNGSFSGSALLTTDGSGSLSASVNISASAFYGDASNLTGVTASAVQVADGPEYSLQFRYDTPVSGDLSGSSDLIWNTGTKNLLVTGNVSASINISGSGLYATNAYVSSVPADRVLVSTTDGQVTSHSVLTFVSDVLSAPTLTASVGIQSAAIEVTSSANGRISIGEGISYNFGGTPRLDIFENEFKLKTTQFYQAMSPVKTSNFDVRNFQVFPVNTSGNVVTGTLPGLTSDDDVGVTFTFKDSEGSGSTNNVVVAASGSQEIDTASQVKIQVNFGSVTVSAISGASDYFWSITSTSP